MAYGKYIEDYRNQLVKIDDILFELEKNHKTINSLSLDEQNTLDFHNYICDLENLTIYDCQELYPFEPPVSTYKEYERILFEMRSLIDRYLICAYKEGEINIVLSNRYQYKGQSTPTLELLKLLPANFYLYGSDPELNYMHAIRSNSLYEMKIYLYLSAKDGYEPAIIMVKEIFNWEI